ncbi:hypothetical protein ONO57_26690, partial [Salmonella enterica subsp. enterica serovar Anatum]|nr:hypothetical protein [Salmonella enterica subsp. enterica serovar Anatum]
MIIPYLYQTNIAEFLVTTTVAGYFTHIPVTACNIVCIKIINEVMVMSQKTLFTKSALAVAVAIISTQAW